MRAIECRDLSKTYGDVHALDGISFEVAGGQILALLGSNGSGKTTTVRILTTLTTPDSGSAVVVGRDVVHEAASVRKLIGLTAQDTVIDGFFTGGEYMALIARLRHIPRARSRRETTGLLQEFGLEEVSKARVGTYSGGMRRRLDIAASLLGDPSVLFLDEPSNGLDPHSRNRLWEVIRRRADDGASVLLTTQYMEEADALADTVVVLANGRVIASGTPDELKDDTGGRVVELTLAGRHCMQRARTTIAAFDVPSVSETAEQRVSFVLPKSSPSLLVILQRLQVEGVELEDVIVRRPTLDEAFLHLTKPADSAAHPQVESAR